MKPMDIEREIIIDPAWKEIIKEIGKQLNFRKGLLVKRTLSIILPAFIAISFLYILGQWGEDIGKFFNWILPESQKSYSEKSAINFFTLFIIGLWFIIFYIGIIKTIFYIEKWIWIDSYFDKRNLDSKASWKLAKKFFFPVVRLYLESFLRFYLLPILIWIILTVIVVDFFIDNLIIPIVWIPASIIALFLYFYYLKIYYLRFSLPYFLDTYRKEGFSFNKFFKEVIKLARADRKKLLWKSVVIEESAHVANVLGQGIIHSLEEGIIEAGSKFGEIPGKIGIIGSVFSRLFGEEASSQVASFAKIIAVYLLYRARCFYLYKTFKPNSYILN